jgi:tetratricopeptide (TPR) repeat protein
MCIEQLEINFDNLLEGKLTFLVGAGISVHTPARLPTGNEMMNAIIQASCNEDDIPSLKTLPGLRFELLIDVIRQTIDPQLSIIDYFSMCDKPNIYHFYLAEMIKKGHFVITTNFDYLLELALLQSNIPQQDIVPVITKNDYENFNDPEKLFRDGKKTVCKIHGSAKNLITNEETRSSLIATIESLGRNKEETSIFQVEPFKREFFENITSGHTLVILGYSGSDDFDIVPSLMSLRNVINLVWVNFNPELGVREKIFIVQKNANYSSPETNKIIGLLQGIKKSNCAARVYLVEANTPLLIERLIKRLGVSPDIKNEPFLLHPSTWIENHFGQIGTIDKNHITAKIYRYLSYYSKSIRILENIRFLVLNKMPLDQYELSYINNEIGQNYIQQGKYQDALHVLGLAVQNCQDFELKAGIYNNIGKIKFDLNEYEESLKFYEAALKIDEALDNVENQGIDFGNIGTVYDIQGDLKTALEYYKKALKISYSTNLWSRATRLNNVAHIYSQQGNYEEAMTYYLEGLAIVENLGDLARSSTYLDNVGTIYFKQGIFSTALRYYFEALSAAQKIGYLFEEVAALFNIASTYFSQGENEKSLDHLEQASVVAEKLCSPEWKTRIYSLIEIIKKGGDIQKHGEIYIEIPIGEIEERQRAAQETLKRIEKEDNKSGSPDENIEKWTQMGHAYLDSYQLDKALRAYEEAYKISQSLDNLDAIAMSLANMGNVYIETNDLDTALNLIKNAYKIYENAGNLTGMARQIGNMGVAFIRKDDPQKALRYFQDAYTMFTKIKGCSEEEKLFHNHIVNVKKLYHVK